MSLLDDVLSEQDLRVKPCHVAAWAGDDPDRIADVGKLREFVSQGRVTKSAIHRKLVEHGYSYAYGTVADHFALSGCKKCDL